VHTNSTEAADMAAAFSENHAGLHSHTITMPEHSHGHGGRCPSCGYCPCCGRRDGWRWPQPGPYWVAPTTTSGTTTWQGVDPVGAALSAAF